MRILQVLHSFVPYQYAGTEVYTYQLSKELAKSNEVSAFFRINEPRKKEYSLEEKDFDGLRTYAINRTFNDCSSFEETYQNSNIDMIFSSLLDKIKPDVVHIQHLLFLSFGIINEVKKRKIPVIFTLHDYWLMCHRGQLVKFDLSLCKSYDSNACGVCIESQLSIRPNAIFLYNFMRRRLPAYFLQLVKKAYLAVSRRTFLSPSFARNELDKRYQRVQKIISQVELFIAPSNFLRDNFISFGVPDNKILFYANGMVSERLVGLKKSVSLKIRFGFIGVLLPTKGVHILIEAFKELKNQDAQLFIYGRLKRYAGFEAYYDDLKKVSSGEARIHFMGHYDNNKIDFIFRDIDVLVVPSVWQENAPLVVQEAVISQTPVIASRIGGIQDFIKDGINGLLFNPGDAADLKEKLEYLVNNRRVIDGLKNEVSKIKSIKDNAEELEATYTHYLSIGKENK